MLLAWKKYLLLVIFGLVAVFAIASVPVDRSYLHAHAHAKALENLFHDLHTQENTARSAFPAWLSLEEALPPAPWKGKIALRCAPHPCTPALHQALQRLGFAPLPRDTAKIKLPSPRQGSPPAKPLSSASQPSSAAPLAPTSKPALSSARSASMPSPRDLESLYPTLHIKTQIDEGGGTALQLRLSLPNDKKGWSWQGERRESRLQWTSILPPLVAIFFVLLTGRVLTSLFISLFLGVWLHLGGGLGTALYEMTTRYIWKESIYKEFSFNIILFTLSLIGMINVCTRSGGVQGLITLLQRHAKTARSSRLLTATLGVLIFFDDYANSIMVGNTMRPMTDRYRVSREKLAYLIDSTAAPIAGIALLSTWIGYEVGLLGDIARSLHLQTSGYSLFLSSLPFRFYCWMTLLFVFVGIWMNRDYGPMYRAERRALEEGKLLRDGATPLVSVDTQDIQPPEGAPQRWYNALLPISLVILVGFFGLLWSGGYFAGKPLRDALGDANSTRVFLVASLVGSFVAIGLAVGQGILRLTEALAVWLKGARAMLFAIGILIFAWSMGALAKDLGSAHYLIAMLQSSLPTAWIPLLIFFMAAIISFATGTSWGTMAILLPTAAPLAYNMGGMPILILSLGAVLDGSIFGDHCSPLSDTTLFSSAAAACDHVDHVKTQAPYALTVMSAAAFFGYLGVAYGFPLLATLLLALLFFFFVFGLFGRDIGQAP